MDILLSKVRQLVVSRCLASACVEECQVTQQAMNYAIRTGITITSGYAITQCSRLIKTQDGKERQELATLQRLLDNKIKIISPAIDMIELITARGNTSLESCVSLTKNLRLDIQSLGVRLASAAADEEMFKRKSTKSRPKVERDQELRSIVSDMRSLLQRLEDAVPLINLAITTSGVSLSTSLPASISPSRLLQASTFLSAGDAQYASQSSMRAQIGPTFNLSVYMLFTGHVSRLQHEEDLRQTTWQEVIHKARVKLVRTSIASLGRAIERAETADPGLSTGHMSATAASYEFAYQLVVVEDLDDGRVHTVEQGQAQPSSFDDVLTAGIREAIPIHEISKIFYADTGKILNIGGDGETNNPVLLLKRDVNAIPPRRMLEQDIEDSLSDDALNEEDPTRQATRVEDQILRETSEEPDSTASNSEEWRFPPGLDPEWIALEVFTEEPTSDTESETGVDEDEAPSGLRNNDSTMEKSSNHELSTHLSRLQLSSASSPADELVKTPFRSSTSTTFASLATGSIRTSLSLLEMLVRLTSLQQFQQASHLTITDELLNFFLEESSTTGASTGDTEERKRIRLEARHKVGFDPYNESPIKRRGEQYQYDQEQGHDATSSPWDDSGARSVSESPLLLRSREHSSASRSPKGSSRVGHQPSRPHSTPLRQSISSLATPPGSTQSR